MKKPKDLEKSDDLLFNVAKSIMARNLIIQKLPSSQRSMWAQGFVNGCNFTTLQLGQKKFFARLKYAFTGRI